MQRLARDSRTVSVTLIALLVVAMPAADVRAEEAVARTEVSFPTADGGEIHAFLYGEGEHGVVLAHGMVFNKESWAPLAPRLAREGLRVLAIDFRGYGSSTAGAEGGKLFLDVVAAMSYLKRQGATRISLVGASMGGGVVSRTAVVSGAGEIDRLVLLAPSAIPKAEEMKAATIVYITAEGDPSVERTRDQYQRAPEPKSLELLPGDAHAQHIFKTEHSDALVELIVAVLTE